MQFLSAFSLLLTVASAARVSLSFTLDAERNMSSLVIYRKNGGILMGVCGRSINTKVPIDFSQVTVKGKGAIPPYGNYNEASTSIIPITSGNFTVGDATYRIHPNPVFAGGPSCKTDVDSVNSRISVYCTKLYWDYTDIIHEMKTVDTTCFGPFPPVMGEFESDYYKMSGPMSKIARRCREKKKETELPPGVDGAGWPHQRYLFEQISDVVHCGNNHTCCVGSDKSKTTAWGYTLLYAAGISIGEGISFDTTITQGFSVTKSWSTGESYTCHGNPGDKVCIWYKVAYTAFTIRKPIKGRKPIKWPPFLAFLLNNECKIHDSQIVMAAPNRNNEGGGVVCKYNDECRSLGDKFWDCYGRQDQRFRYCPPPGYPPKLHRDKSLQPQCLEAMAVRKAREEESKRIQATEGQSAWMDHQREREEYKHRLERDYEARWGDVRQQEKIEEEKRKEEEEAANKDPKDLKKDADEAKKNAEKAKEVKGQMDF